MRRASGEPEKHHVERCISGKKKSTYAQAKKEARFLKYHKKYPGQVPQAYKCKLCSWWHVGNAE